MMTKEDIINAQKEWSEGIIKMGKLSKDRSSLELFVSEFDNNFQLIRVIQSEKIDIKENNWIIYNPIITNNNSSIIKKEKILLKTNFNYEKINNIFSNVSTLDFLKLFRLKKDFEDLGYSTSEIYIHLLKLFTTPIIYSILTIISSILMINTSKSTPLFYHISLGFFVSVIIYYIMFFFSSLAISGGIPVIMSYLFPIMFLSIISIMGLVSIHDK